MLVHKKTLLATFTALAVLTATAAITVAQETTKQEETERVKIPVKVRTVQGNNIQVNLSNLKPDAQAAGLGDMILEANVRTERLQNGDEKLTLIWGTAKKGEKSTYVDEAFMSEIIAEGGLKEGEQFSAEGSPADLLAAWQRLNQLEEQQQEEEQAEQQPQDIEAKQAATNTGGGGEPEAQPFQGPEFEVSEEPQITETADGCSMNIDIEQMVAIQQKRVLENGEEISPCADTLDRYPLEKKFASCPVSFNEEEATAYEQYILTYNDPATGGQVQVQSCTPDEDRPIQMTEDTSSCTLRHDFEEGRSYQQARTVYMHQGALQEFKGCHDTETFHNIITTDQGCDPIGPIDGMMTFQYRHKIETEDGEMFISQCEPNPSTQTAVVEEICSSPRYTHDFQSGQSYLNKTFWYEDQDGDRVDIAVCQQSTETLAHKQDTEGCSAVHDDQNLETTMRARTFIEEEQDERVYSSSCEDVLPKVPYAHVADVWKERSLGLIEPELNEFDGSSFYFVGTNANKQIDDWGRYPATPYYADFKRKYRYLSRDNSVWSMPTYCATQTFTPPMLYNNKEINLTMSNMGEILPYEWDGGISVSYISGWKHHDSNGINHYATCGFDNNVQCQASELKAHPRYLRADGSHFLDEDTVLQTTLVCNTGADYDGQEVTQ